MEDDEVLTKVIVAEDHPAMRRLVATSLRGAGFDVIEVGDGQVLLETLRDALDDDDNPCEASLIVTDVRMPKCSGLEVLQRLRGSKRRLPVIVMTAFGDVELHAEARRLGAALVLNKPFDVRDLVSAAVRLAPPR